MWRREPLNNRARRYIPRSRARLPPARSRPASAANKAEAHSIQSKAARKLENTIWIDESDRQVARLEVEFYDNFRVAGGLFASIQKGTIIKIEQSPIGKGLWMQTGNEQHMNMRIITKGVRENVSMKSFDFKRFNVDAAAAANPAVSK